MTPNMPNRSPELADATAALAPYVRRAFAYSLLVALLVLAPSLYMLEVYDRVVNSRNANTLLMLTVLLLGIFVVMEVLEWVRARLLLQAGSALDRRLGDRLFTAMLEANQRRIPGGSPQAMTDLRNVRDFLGSPPVHAAMEAPIALVYLLIVSLIHPVLGWASLVGALLQLAVGWWNERSTQPPLVQASQSAMAAQSYAEGAMRNAEVVAAMGMHEGIQRRWAERQRKFLQLQSTASRRATTTQALTKFLQVMMGSILLGVGAWLILQGQLEDTGALLIVASILGARVLAPLVVLVTQWRSVVQFREAWARLEELLTRVPPREAGMPLPRPTGALQVDGLIAGAPGSGAPILRGVAFSVKPGEVCTVIGPSASGKTTLTRLLVGLWPAMAGKVRLDGVDVHAWNKEELGPAIGYLPQFVELFEGTLAENIARFGEVDAERVRRALSLVGLLEWAEALPQGLDTPIGADGAVLSAGQRQRVGLARALYGDPVFVVLDEPNSSLDEAGDAALVAAVAELKRRGTTFVIAAHRTSVLPVTDRLLVLRDGQMHAFGPRDEVLAALQRGALPSGARLIPVRGPAQRPASA